MADDASNQILHDFSPLMRVYKDGRVERLEGEDVVPASLDPGTGVQSKDIRYEPEKEFSARLYLPKEASSTGRHEKIPLLVYFHGGGFIVDYAFSSVYHNYMNRLVAEARVVCVSVNYRLAPEHPLPTAYEDSWLALKWVANHVNGHGDEAWLKDHADFNRFYLGGESAGANIAHNMAMRIGMSSGKFDQDGGTTIKISGMFLECPYFWGEKPIKGQDTHRQESYLDADYLSRLWRVAYRNASSLDDPQLNPAMDPNIWRLACKKVFVFVAEKDVLKYRGWQYRDVLLNSGWVGDVEVVEVEGEDHAFHLSFPGSENSMWVVKKLASFLNDE